MVLYNKYCGLHIVVAPNGTMQVLHVVLRAFTMYNTISILKLLTYVFYESFTNFTKTIFRLNKNL
jgi:hypothetical protein